MRTFVHWVLAQRYRLIALAVALAPLFPVATTALLALETRQRGAQQGLISSLFALGGIIALATVAGASVPVVGLVGAVSLLAGVAIGAVLRWAGSLSLAFQALLLGCVVVVAGGSLAGFDPSTLLAPIVDELVATLEERDVPEQDLAGLREWAGMLFVAVFFSQLVASMFLAHWWFSLATGTQRFGPEFRALKLGRVLGVPATALIGLGLVFATPLVQNLVPLALFGFWFQGLAVLHAWAHARQWHPVVIAPVYLLLVTPLTGLIILGLGSVGLLDNWIDLRASLRKTS